MSMPPAKKLILDGDNSVVSYVDKTLLRFPADDLENENTVTRWTGSVLGRESSLHQIAPYIGKMKSSIAGTLVSEFTRKSQTIYDPFCGSGTVALEAWTAGRNVIANDLSPYAATLTRAKLFPYLSLDRAIGDVNTFGEQVRCLAPKIDLRKIPSWVRSFFHPETLREVVAWAQILRSKRSYFLLSCLLGILHHQRPGFLSYPSSHTVPYLRDKNFPPHLHPELYEYRNVQERLEKKVRRALRRVPNLDPDIKRECYMRDASTLLPPEKIEAIITSPPYMRQLDYGRDNRLRLWFLGTPNWRSLDEHVSPSEKQFYDLCRSCFRLWQNVLTRDGLCILVLGDTYSYLYGMPLYDAVAQVAKAEVGGYSVLCKYTEPIPNARRVRRGYRGSLNETVLVLCKKAG